ncbi:MAG: nickel pincer cofactor biosynthesis protein LarC [Acidobacteria bacterium]|nr:nickel pincer cofactor biosynthesis protein LarC [Acidobacteriota bacterium]
MGKTLYFDCFSGVSGDMVVGGLLDLGLSFEDLRAALGSLAVEHAVGARRVLRAGISATKFSVTDPHQSDLHSPHSDAGAHPPHTHEGGSHPPHSHEDASHHHSLKEIAAFIERSALSPEGRDRAIHLFDRLARAESAIHGTPLDRVHLHEVGALDSIIDIVGAVYGLETLGADQVISSPLNVGSGTVTCAHGVFPVPAPATARLLEGVPVYAGEVRMELVTPTGALLVTEYAGAYGPLPPLTIRSIGYGAGDRDPEKHPNVLRLIVGDEASTSTERIVEIACEIDDMNPQLFGPLMERLHAAGALDVFYAPVQMKKGRPGTLVTILSKPALRETLTGILFSETTTIGVRYQEMMRERLDREIHSVVTPVGTIRFKVASRDGRRINAAPEFDDCARIAAERAMPIKDVQAIAMKAWLDRAD